MKALVYHGPGQKSSESVGDPKPVDPTDIVVRIDTTTICGTDLAHPQGRRARGDRWQGARPRGGRHGGGGRLGGEHAGGGRPGDRPGDHLVRAVRELASARCRATASPPAALLDLRHLIDAPSRVHPGAYAETSVHKVPEGVTDQQVAVPTDILPRLRGGRAPTAA